MGRPKHRVVVGGRELAGRVGDALRTAGCHPVFQVGVDDPVAGLEFVPDRWPGAGPVGGIITALEHLEQWRTTGGGGPDEILVAACDLPDLDATTLELLRAHPFPPSAGAVGAVAGGHLVPVARWRVSTRGRLVPAFEAGLRSWWGALDAVGAATVEVPTITTGDLDTPGDLARWSDSVIP